MVADTAIGALLASATLLPLAWKWQLGVRRAAVVVLAIGCGLGLARGGHRPRRGRGPRAREPGRVAPHGDRQLRDPCLPLLSRPRTAGSRKRRRGRQPSRWRGHLRAALEGWSAASRNEGRPAVRAGGTNEDTAPEHERDRRGDQLEPSGCSRQPGSDRGPSHRAASLQRQLQIAEEAGERLRERACHHRDRAGRPRDRGGPDRLTPRAADQQLRRGRTAGGMRRADRSDQVRLAGGPRTARGEGSRAARPARRPGGSRRVGSCGHSGGALHRGTRSGAAVSQTRSNAIRSDSSRA